MANDHVDMVAIRLASGERLRVPNSWRTTTTDIFQKIIEQWEPDKPIKERSVLKLFNIMIGMDISPEEDDLDLEAAIWECTRYVYNEQIDFAKLPLPKYFNIGGVVIELPKDLGRLKIGQNIHVRQELQAVKDPNAAMSIVTAIYLQPIYDKVVYGLKESLFDFHRAKELEKIILQMPITDVYPVGFFFLMQLRTYGRGFLPNLSRMIQMKIQSVQLLLNWRRLKNLINSLQ